MSRNQKSRSFKFLFWLILLASIALNGYIAFQKYKPEIVAFIDPLIQRRIDSLEYDNHRLKVNDSLRDIEIIKVKHETDSLKKLRAYTKKKATHEITRVNTASHSDLYDIMDSILVANGIRQR
jgi:hypothetical protein